MEIQRLSISEEHRLLISDFMCEQYSSVIDFNTLMPVVEKIESLEYAVFISKVSCYIQDSKGEIIAHAMNWGTKKIAIYQAVVMFIKWYNQNKTK